MISLNQIIEFLRDDIRKIEGSNKQAMVNNIRSTEETDEYSLDWVNPRNEHAQLIAEQSKAKVLLVGQGITYSNILKKHGKVLLYVKNPKRSLAQAGEHFFSPKPEPGVHPSAILHPNSHIGKNVHIGAGCVLGDCSIGDNTVIYPNVTIYDKVEIGSDCIIHAGVVIGTDGLGCERTETGELVKFPHLGGVQIGNMVELGSNTIIDRGTLSNTIIGDGAKVNGHCLIAHNCILKKNVWISFGSIIAGSTIIEDNVTIWSQCTIREHRIIGKGATIGMGSIVTKSVPPGETWVGNPAKKLLK